MRRFALLVTVGLVVVFGWGSWASAVPAYNPSTTGLVATYEFRGEASDVSGNRDDGVVTRSASPTTDRSGTAASVLNFDGSTAYVQTPVDNNHIGIGFSTCLEPDNVALPSDGFNFRMGRHRAGGPFLILGDIDDAAGQKLAYRGHEVQRPITHQPSPGMAE